MNVNKALLALALGLALAACADNGRAIRSPDTKTIAQARGEVTGGLERRVERFSKIDEYGVMCYQDRYRSDSLSCVKVQ